MPNTPLAVTVVVPVFNAGPYLERCSPSLLDQSIGRDHYEVVYVDDGSTDGSGAFLDDLAAKHPHVRVHHQENSGWPGKPRNVGVAMARGEFVQFVDQDDRLAPRALERLVELGRRSSADVVVGKTAGTMVGPRRLFRDGVEGGSVVESGLAQSLTGHKMFRTAFLRDNGIAFPEGYWRLEDILFVVRAYTHDPVVSVLADHPCYFWDRREDGGNHSTAAFDLEGHFERLEVIVRTIVDGTPPGPLREALLHQLLRAPLLNLVSGHGVISGNEQRSRAAHALGGRIVRELIPRDTWQRMPGILPLRVAALVDGTWEDSRNVALRIKQTKLTLEKGQVRWEGGRLVMPLAAEWRRHRKPVGLVPVDGGFVWEACLAEGLVGATEARVAEPLADAFADVAVLDKKRHVWWWAHSPLTASLDGTPERVVPRLVGSLVIDPTRIIGGRQVRPGTYRLALRGQLLGMPLAGRLRTKVRGLGRAVVGRSPVLVALRRSGKHLEMTVRPAVKVLSRELASRPPAGGSPRLPRRGPVRVKVRLGRLHLDGPLRLADGPVRLDLVAGAKGAALLEIGRRTTLRSGRRRVELAGGTLGTALVAGGRILWFRGAG